MSLLANCPLLIKNIRADDVEAPGLRPHEVSFLRLLESMTNGSTFEINNTGTQLRFLPGILLGGDIHNHCPITATTNEEDEDDSFPPRLIGVFGHVLIFDGKYIIFSG